MRLFESVQPTLTNEKIKKILKPLLSGNVVKNFLVACITVGIVFFCAIQVSAQKEQFKVTFINPGISDINDPTGGFWLSVSAFMSAAAKDLNVDLEILYSERDHVLMQKQAQEVARRKDPPDYLLVVNEKLSAGRMIEVADAAEIKTFMMLNTFVKNQAQKYGKPREKYKNWIGTLIPNNQSAGYQIAKLIIDRALEAGVKATDGKLHIVAVAGDRVTQASVERVRGLKQAVSEYPDVTIKQVIFGEWRKDKSYERTKALLKRYPQVGAIWAANDPMALGAAEGARAAGKQPGKEVFIGGLNWDAPGLQKTKEGVLVTTVGGHFMTGGWALVLLYDYHHGKDFAEEGLQLQRKIFGALHNGNIDIFLERLGDRDWSKIDFAKFSKVLNPSIREYNFGLDAILHQNF